MTGRIRVLVVQPLLPAYRVPLYDRLAAEPDLDVTVWAAGEQRGYSLRPAQPGAFRYREVRRTTVGPLTWQPSTIAAAWSRPDVLVIHGAAREATLAPATLLARARGARVILWGHGRTRHDTAAGRAIRRAVLGLADAQLLYNESAARDWRAAGYPADAVFVAPNALDQGPIASARERQLRDPGALDAFARKHGFERGNSVLFVSRLEPQKRPDLLLDAFARLARKRPASHLVVVGDGNEAVPLRARAARLGIGEQTTFTGALYGEDNVAPWFLTAGVFAYPNAIGLSLFHAFGYGVPVVTSGDVDAHNPEIEAFRPGVNGLAFRRGDADDFAATLASVLDDPPLRERLARGALATVAPPDGWRIERTATAFAHAIRAVAARRNGR